MAWFGLRPSPCRVSGLELVFAIDGPRSVGCRVLMTAAVPDAHFEKQKIILTNHIESSDEDDDAKYEPIKDEDLMGDDDGMNGIIQPDKRI